jgi:hypothetical protein
VIVNNLATSPSIFSKQNVCRAPTIASCALLPFYIAQLSLVTTFPQKNHNFFLTFVWQPYMQHIFDTEKFLKD